MATNVVEQMLIELGFADSKFASEAEKAIKKTKELEKALTNTEKASKKSEKANDELAKKQHNAIEQTAKFGEAIAKVTKELTGFFAIIIGSTGLFKLANDAARANMEVSKLSGQLGMNTRSITDWRNAAGAFGGSAEGMTASLTGIKQAMNGLVMFGDASMLPYFNALGVNVVDTAGKVRQLDDVMLDLADAFQKMPRDQAYTIGKKMGFDDGTINALGSGRKELQEILAIQKQMHHSDEKAIARSKELIKQQAILNAHWQSMKQMIGDALTPILISLIKVVNGFFEFLQKHEKVVTAVFKVAAVVIGMLLIPTLLSAGRALLGFIAPFTPLIKVFGLLGAAISPVTLLITALSAAFLLLFDDYKTWSEGGKSLFDWGALSAGIKECKLFVDALSDSFANMSRAFSDMVMNMIASVTGENVDDISGFIGESVYRLTHGGKTFDEVEGVTQLPVFSKSSSSNSSSTPADAAVKAAQFATKHAGAKSKNGCGWAVNEAFRKQGIKAWGHGKDVAKNLISTGQFQSIPYSKNYVPQIGDVMSIPAGYGQHAQYGHVAIWNGTRWVSDYTQQVLRGNTAATNDESYKNILSGKVTPVIARMKSTSGSSEVVRKGMMAAAAVPVQNKAVVANKSQAAAKPAKSTNTSTDGKVAQPNFRNKNFTKEKAESIARVAKNIGVDPNDLAAVISFETGGTFNPNIRNPKSSATGLIQFMAGSGGKKGLYYGMTRDQFGGLSFDEQMKYVERYFKERGFDGKRKRDVADTYTAVTGYGYRKGSKAYELNKVWDSNKDNYIAKGEMVRNAKFRAHQRQYYANIANNAQKALDMVSQNQQMQTSSNSIKNDNRKQVNVNIQKMEVKTSSSTVSGNAVAAMKELQNYTFNQLGTSMT